MTTFGKCLVVFALLISIGFLGTTLVSWGGGMNWDAESAALPGYTIKRDDAPNGKWTVTERNSNQSVNVPTAPTVQAAAIVAAWRDLEKRQTTELAELEKETKEYQQKKAEVVKFGEADLKALKDRVEELNKQLSDLNAKILGLSNDVVQRSQEAQAIRNEVTRRREDVYRLTRELDEIRADSYRAEELQKRLNEQLVRLKGVVAALESRNKQLRNE